jgi:hypothetical protein
MKGYKRIKGEIARTSKFGHHPRQNALFEIDLAIDISGIFVLFP